MISLLLVVAGLTFLGVGFRWASQHDVSWVSGGAIFVGAALLIAGTALTPDGRPKHDPPPPETTTDTEEV